MYSVTVLDLDGNKLEPEDIVPKSWCCWIVLDRWNEETERYDMKKEIVFIRDIFFDENLDYTVVSNVFDGLRYENNRFPYTETILNTKLNEIEPYADGPRFEGIDGDYKIGGSYRIIKDYELVGSF